MKFQFRSFLTRYLTAFGITMVFCFMLTSRDLADSVIIMNSVVAQKNQLSPQQTMPFNLQLKIDKSANDNKNQFVVQYHSKNRTSIQKIASIHSISILDAENNCCYFQMENFANPNQKTCGGLLPTSQFSFSLQPGYYEILIQVQDLDSPRMYFGKQRIGITSKGDIIQYDDKPALKQVSRYHL